MKSVNELLIERIQAYFKEKYGLDLSPETAEEYLKSYAGLFAVIAKVEQRRARTVPETDLSVRGGALLADDEDSSLGVSNT